MLFYQYTGFSAIPQAPEWLPRADNSHIVYVSFLDEETGRPDAALCADLAAAGIDFVRVGDCKKVGKIINGVWEAFQIAYRI